MTSLEQIAAMIERYAWHDDMLQALCPHCGAEVTIPESYDDDYPCPACGQSPHGTVLGYDPLGIFWFAADLAPEQISRVNGHPECCRILLDDGIEINTYTGTVSQNGASIALSDYAIEQLNEEVLCRIDD